MKNSFKKTVATILCIIICISFITVCASAEDQTNGYINGTYVRFRSGPSLSASVYDYLHTGYPVCIYGQCGDWYEISYAGTVGYAYKDYVVLEYPVAYQISVDSNSYWLNNQSTNNTVTYSEETTVVENTPEITPSVNTDTVITPTEPSADAYRLIEVAKKYIGSPYVWGGTSPDGFDCSGFVQYVFNECGYSVSRVAQSQSYNGVNVDLSNILPGDILCFGSSAYNIYHSAIYIGNNQFIHSSSPEGVVISSLNGYGLDLVVARRVI